MGILVHPLGHSASVMSHCLTSLMDGGGRLAAQRGGTAFVEVFPEAQGPGKVVELCEAGLRGCGGTTRI